MPHPIKDKDGNVIKGKWGAKARDRHGKQTWLGTFTSSDDAKDAEERFRVKERAAKRSQRGRRGPKPEERIGTYGERWLEEHPRPSRNTQESYKRGIGRFISLFGDELLRDFDVELAEEFLVVFPHDWPAASSMMTFAVKDRLADFNPFMMIRGKPRAKGRRSIEPPTEAAVLEAADYAIEMYGPIFGPVLRAMIIVSAYVGCRNGELFALKRSSIDANDFVVNIDWQINRFGEETRPKFDSRRKVIIPPIALDALDQLKVKRIDSPYLFHTKKGSIFTQSSLQYYWFPLREECFGRDADIDWYWFRHWCGSHMAGHLRLDEYAIAHQLGHSDPSVTRRIYIHTNHDLARERTLAAHVAHANDNPFLDRYRENRRAA